MASIPIKLKKNYKKMVIPNIKTIRRCFQDVRSKKLIHLKFSKKVSNILTHEIIKYQTS
jgi:hypothetical protein